MVSGHFQRSKTSRIKYKKGFWCFALHLILEKDRGMESVDVFSEQKLPMIKDCKQDWNCLTGI